MISSDDPPSQFPYIIDRSGSKTIIRFGQLLRDLSWSEFGGAIQTEFARATVTDIQLDFSQLTWADPLPLLTLACEIHRFVGLGGKRSVEIDLGRRRPEGRNYFLIFFTTQGFAHQMMPRSRFRWDGRLIESASGLELAISELDFAPLYRNADCIKARIFSCEELAPSLLPTLVERIIEEADRLRIERWLSGQSRSRDFLLQIIGVIISETLDNIAEHAYHAAAASSSYGGLYARIRGGHPENPDELERWRTARLNERTHCPTLARNNCGKQPGWLELFVCDVGRGITEELVDDKAAPLRHLTDRLFVSPISRIGNRVAEKRTEVTGLKHIGDVLRRGAEEHGRTGFVRVYCNGEWAGEHLPWPPPENEASYKNFRRTADREPLRGTALHFSIEPSVSEIIDRGRMLPFFFFMPTINELEEVRRVLSEPGPTLFSKRCHFIDFQKAMEIELEPAGRGPAVNISMKRISASTVIIRPSRVFRKTDLISQLSNIGSGPGIRIERVIYADVPASRAIDMGHLLHEDRLWQFYPHSNLVVYVLSQDWTCMAFRLNPDRRSFSEDRDAAIQFVVGGASIKDGAALVASVLREQDSKLFWDSIGDGYVNEKVIWRATGRVDPGQEFAITGYLDLPIALANERCYRIARRAMRRAAMSFAHSDVLTADEMIRPLVEGIFSVHDGARSISSKPQPLPVVLIGTVVMTGSTITGFFRRTDIVVKGIAHLLAHVDNRKKIEPGFEVLALRWLPQPLKPKEARRPYERIAGTSHIIRGGDFALTLPRFRAPSAEGNLGDSLYGDDPNSAYAFWQRRGLLRVGHWIYGLHHELLTVSLGDALRLDFAGQKRIAEWITNVLNTFRDEPKGKGVPLIVIYPRHDVTDYLMRVVSSEMGSGTIRLFPLQLIRTSSVSPIMFSPVERERVGIYIGKHFRNGGIVVLIDDGVVTGKTFRELTQLIEGLWEVQTTAGRIKENSALEIRTVALMDRTGIPTQRSLVEKFVRNNPRLWRWDVPSLGHEASCPMCAILDRCRDLRTKIQNNDLQRRIDQWIEAWEPVPVEGSRLDKGLTPSQIAPPDTTKFCIEKTRSGAVIAHQVYHHISTSRAALAAEICRSTTRKDYALSKVLSGKFRDGRDMDLQTKIEILSSNLLLFINELTLLDRLARLEMVLELLWESRHPSPATALATLTSLADPQLCRAVWSTCHHLIERYGFPNDDALLAAIATYHLGGRRGRVTGESGAWSLFRILVAPTNAVRGLLCRIFQVVGSDADTFHRGVLLDLLNKDPPSGDELMQIVLIVEALARALSQLMPEIAYGTSLDPLADASALEESIRQIRDLSDQQIRLTGSILGTQSRIRSLADSCLGNDVMRLKLRDILTNVYAFVFSGENSLQATYRASLCVELQPKPPASFWLDNTLRELSSNWRRVLQKKDSDTIAKWNEGNLTPVISFFDSQKISKPIFVYMDALVTRCITEVLSNVMHRSRPVRCPWSEELEAADAWMRIFEVDATREIVLEVANLATPGSPLLKRTFASVYLDNLGGMIETRTEGELYTVRISIPTLAGLASEV